MLHVDYGKKFSKQAEKCKRRGKNMQKLRDVVLTISKGEPLAEKHRNHYLENRKCWDCHIEPDWVLLYRIHDDVLILELLETGTHSDLFKEAEREYSIKGENHLSID